MKSFLLFVIQLLYIFSHFETLAVDLECGDWESYKEEKCFKILDNSGFKNIDDAGKACLQQDNSSSLVTIHSMEEQEFFSNLLFKTHKVVDSIWIGAKRSSSNFKWVDGSDVSFTNWAEGSPSKQTGNDCVQMMPETSLMGKWVDEPCTKKNLVVCEKKPTCSQLKNTLLVTKKQLEDTQNKLKNINNLLFESSHFKTFSDSDNRRKAIIFPTVNPYCPRETAIKICNEYNATLVGIESAEKQMIVETFLRQLPQSVNFVWTSGYKDSSGKFKWTNNGKQISYTNWEDGSPSVNIYIAIVVNYNIPLGKWVSQSETDSNNVVC